MLTLTAREASLARMVNSLSSAPPFWDSGCWHL